MSYFQACEIPGILRGQNLLATIQTSSQADFMHEKLLPASWDVEELVAMKWRFESDPGLLGAELNGEETLRSRELMAEPKEVRRGRA